MLRLGYQRQPWIIEVIVLHAFIMHPNLIAVNLEIELFKKTLCIATGKLKNDSERVIA